MSWQLDALRQKFYIDGCPVVIEVTSLDSQTSEPRYSITWLRRPDRLTPALMTEFESLKRIAVSTIERGLVRLQRATT